MIVSMHQPDFLPYSGFFYKYFKSDRFDLSIFDQFSASGYHRRVKMGGTWVTLACVRLKKMPRETSIKDIMVYTDKSLKAMFDGIEKAYEGAKYYDKVVKDLKCYIENSFVLNKEKVSLADFNKELINWVIAYLGEDYEDYSIEITRKPTKPKADGIIEIMQEYYSDCDTYLSGEGGKNYIKDEFDKAGLNLIYSKHEPKYSDSVVAVLVNEDDPMSVILREKMV